MDVGREKQRNRKDVLCKARLYQTIANDAADGIYVIERDTYDLLYANESVKTFTEDGDDLAGRKCYEALHGKDAPCTFCVLGKCLADGRSHEMLIPEYGASYSVKVKENEWNGIPVNVVYVVNITEEAAARREKERLERYYQTLIRNLPGGVMVLRFRSEESLAVEFLSDGLAAMIGLSQEEALALYEKDIRSGIHPEDADTVMNLLHRHLYDDLDVCEVVFRLRRKDGSYLWVRNHSSRILEEDGVVRIYAVCSDVSHDMEEQIRLRRKYDDMLIQHHRTLDPDEIIAGHCNITQGRMIEVTDKTDSHLLEQFGMDREVFFTAFGNLILDSRPRREFMDRFLNQPMRQAYLRGELKHEMRCFIRLPQEKQGRFVRISVELVCSPESGDVIGVLSVKDETEQVMAERVLHRLVDINYDFIADVDLIRGRYKLISAEKKAGPVPAKGSFTTEARPFLEEGVLPKDQELCSRMLDFSVIRERLAETESYSFHYSVMSPGGLVQTKNMLIYYIDEQLGRVCLSRTDVTESVREQQGLLNMLAYTFELAGIIDLATESYVKYTRESVLNNLAPYRAERFSDEIQWILDQYAREEDRESMQEQFLVETMRRQLDERPAGYEFIYPYRMEGELCYKQFNVLWGDDNHNTICIVRADVTEMLVAEQNTKENLKNALVMAQEASKAKSDFLSSMSHDIRTPMNAIIGMTDLALADQGNPDQIRESLSVIKNSSEHLLTLINDILDMSRIESGRMILARETFRHSVETRGTVERNQVLADKKKIKFQHFLHVTHDSCVGDALRVRQILDNLLSNAFKFTPEGGTVTLEVTELVQKNEKVGWYRFVVSDSGVGIEKDKLPLIFEPFYRVESLDVRCTEGTGLGLSIVKNLVDYKGGMIEVKSEPGEGTTFIVTLPLHFAADTGSAVAEDRQSLPEVRADLSGRRILLVEDHPVNQLVAGRILEKTGASVIIADNGKEGLEKFQKSETGTFDLILMDIQMPVMNGYEATGAIRSSGHPQARSIPIIAMTANAFSGDVRRCLDAGMNAHVAKPIEQQKLFRVLMKYL